MSVSVDIEIQIEDNRGFQDKVEPKDTMRIFEGRICPPPEGKIVITVARFNKTITQRLLDGAVAKLRQHGVHDNDIQVVWVPGSYELPFIANYFARDPECLAIICLGAVIKGDTSHDQHINRYVSMSIGEIACQYSKPIIFGVITCDNIEQANIRSGMIESLKDKTVDPAPGNKGAEAAEAALEMIDLLEEELPAIELPMPEETFAHFLEQLTNENSELFDLRLPVGKRAQGTPAKKIKKQAKKKSKGNGK